jgi:hypothetical protein
MAVPLETENLSLRHDGKSGNQERQGSRFRQGPEAQVCQSMTRQINLICSASATTI